MYAVTSIVLAGALSVSAPPPAAAPQSTHPATLVETPLSSSELRSQVLARLSAIDTPIPRSAWEALGARAEPILRELVLNRADLPTRRAKAIDGLAAVGGPAAASVLRDMARTESEPVVVRFAAVRGLGQVTEPAAVAQELGALLAYARDSRVRAYAGEILVRRGGRANCSAIHAQVSTEGETARGHFGRALALCERQ